jgi:branched-chain amino acid transport system ATP-binding protein
VRRELPMHDVRAAAIRVSYGDARALDGVDLHAPGGEVTAVVGPNGAGKSSLLLAMYGSVRATGSVVVDGADMSARSATERLRAGLALVPQGRQLFPRLTVSENLQLMVDLLGLGPEHLDEALARFPILGERSRALAGVLSGGEQQMLAVSRALMGSPRVLLLDEMMTGLAPKIVSALADIVAQLAADSGVAIVVAEPGLGPIRRVVTSGVVLVRGRVVARADDVEELEASHRAAMGVGSAPSAT